MKHSRTHSVRLKNSKIEFLIFFMNKLRPRKTIFNSGLTLMDLGVHYKIFTRQKLWLAIITHLKTIFESKQSVIPEYEYGTQTSNFLTRWANGGLLGVHLNRFYMLWETLPEMEYVINVSYPIWHSIQRYFIFCYSVTKHSMLQYVGTNCWKFDWNAC